MQGTLYKPFVAAFVVFTIAVSAFAQEAAPATTKAATAPSTVPSTLPADAKPLTAKIISVKGVVKVRQAEEKPWLLGKIGMILDQGAELQTGLRSAVQLFIEPDQTITLDRLGTVKLLQLFQNQGKVTTDLGMKYGRTQYDIKATDLEHQSTIRSPGSTLAIRGTDIIYEDQAPWQPNAISRTGRGQFRNYRKEFLAFGGKKPAAIAVGDNSPGQNAVDKTTADPRGKFAGRTDSETVLLTSLGSSGGSDVQLQQAFQSLFGGLPPNTSATGVLPVAGPLHIELGWGNASNTALPANLDLIVTDPLGNIASAAHPIVGTGSAQGMHGGDDRGSEGFGLEFADWGLFFPPGTYKVQAIHEGGADAQITISALQKDTQIKFLGGDPVAPIVLKPGETFTTTVTTVADPTPVTPGARQKGRRNSTPAKNPAPAQVVRPGRNK